ncbi:MAG: alpha/beta hydrolase [Cytophagaceae bacterium]
MDTFSGRWVLIFFFFCSAGFSQPRDSTYTLYLIPGLGMDERLFQGLDVPCKIKVIKWIPVNKHESLKDYALRMAQAIDTTHPFSIAGVSFGGMCVIEIAKVYKPRHAILISSIKTKREMPFRMKLLRIFPIYRIMSDQVCIRSAMIARSMFGIQKAQSGLFHDMMKTMPPKYYRRAVHCVVSWKNKVYPSGLMHIHGSKDRIFPLKKIKDPVVVPGGTHLMILTDAQNISVILKTIFP